MKSIRSVPLCVLALALVPLGGCLEIGIKTRISDDGSSERTISVRRQSKDLPEHAYPLPGDPSWAAEWKETGDKDLPYEYFATKRFATPEDLSREYSAAPDTGAVRLSVTLDRRFEWFYTYFDYRETYTLRNPFRRIPATDFFTPAEIGLIAGGGKSDSLNVKIEEWDYRNTFEEYYARLIDAVGEGDAEVNRARLEGAKEEIFRRSREDTSDTETELIRNMVALLGRVLRTGSLARYEGAVARIFAEVDSMENLRRSANSWASSVVMPGVVVSTNGEAVEGSEIRWKIESKRLLVTEITMEARSRVTNPWAFGVAGLVALALLIPVAVRIMRRPAGI